MIDDDFLNEIKEHTTSPITVDDLQERLNAVEEAKTDLDEITVVED